MLAHTRMRPLLVTALGDPAVTDAEKASAGWDRAEAVSRARTLLERMRFSDH